MAVALSPQEIAAREADVRRLDWLTSGGLDVESWVEIQNARTENFLTSLPLLEAFKGRLVSIIGAEYRSVPIIRGDRSFQLRRGVGEQQASLWVADEHGDRCLVAATELGSISDSITEFAPSPDGSVVAWAKSTGGADWMIARFRDTETGVDADDVIDGIKWPQFAWLDDETVAYMSWGRPPVGQELLAINSDSSVRTHKLGTSQDQDVILLRPKHTAWVLPSVSADRKWLLVQELDGTVPAKIYRQPADLSGSWETVIDGSGPDELIDVFRDETLVLSFATESRGQIVAVTSENDARVTRVIRGAADGATIDRALLVGHRLVIVSNTITGSTVQVLDLDTAGDFDEGGEPENISNLALPENAVIHDLGVHEESDRLFVDLERIGGSRVIVTYRLGEGDMGEGDTRQPQLPAGTTDAGTVTSEWKVSTVMATSADGTSVPMRVVRAAGAEPAGTAKVFLSVYGGYGVPYVSTSYESWQRAWLEAGGVLAYAGVRGGSEYGEQWHQAGTRHNKQRGIDDLIACVSWFEENGWSEPKSVVINGMSNGGLMVSTVIVQRPELLGGAVPEVAVIDMLNFHKYTAAHGWIREYGDPENPEDRAMLASYSPLHNVADVEYPPILVLTADKDDRVPPGPHSYKFAAALQDTSSGRGKTYLRVAYNAGHGSGRSLLEKVTERSAVLAFAANAIGLEAPSLTERMELTK